MPFRIRLKGHRNDTDRPCIYSDNWRPCRPENTVMTHAHLFRSMTFTLSMLLLAAPPALQAHDLSYNAELPPSELAADRLQAYSVQHGNNNRDTISQKGNSMIASVGQWGQGNASNVVQNGTGNVVYSEQYGSNNTATYFQYGHGNTATGYQVGQSNALSIHQTTSHGIASASPYGNLNSAA